MSKTEGPVRIRVLMVDDHAILREGLRALLSYYEDVEVVGRSAGWRRSGRAGGRAAARRRPDGYCDAGHERTRSHSIDPRAVSPGPRAHSHPARRPAVRRPPAAGGRIRFCDQTRVWGPISSTPCGWLRAARRFSFRRRRRLWSRRFAAGMRIPKPRPTLLRRVNWRSSISLLPARPIPRSRPRFRSA